MALPLVKVGVLVGAGILGSYLVQEGRVSDVLSGAFKIAWKQIRDDKSKAPSDKKPASDALMAQMNKIRQELKSYSSSGPVTIVTGNRTGASKYDLIIIVIVAGSGYLWWKGWRFPDMMFATRCSLADAGKSISKQIDGVFSSISVTKRQLSSNLDGVDRSLAECIETIGNTQQEVMELKGKTDSISTDFKKVQHAVLTLETKINRIEGKQDATNDGVWKLCDYAKRLENSTAAERIQASSSNSSGRSLELPPASPSSSLKTPNPQHHQGMLKTLERYQKSIYGAPEAHVSTREALELSSQQEYLKLKARHEALQRNQRNLLGEDLGPLSSKELESLERQMDMSLKHVRSTWTQFMVDQLTDLQRKEHLLNEANRALKQRLFEEYNVHQLQLNANAEDAAYGRQQAHHQHQGYGFFQALQCEPTLQIAYQQNDPMLLVTAGTSVNYVGGWLP